MLGKGLNPLSTADGVSFQDKALIYACDGMLYHGFDPNYIKQLLSMVKHGLKIRGAIKEKSEFYSPSLWEVIGSYGRILDDELYEDDCFHDSHRVELFRASLEDFLAFIARDPRYKAHAGVLSPMALINSGASLRPGESMVTTETALAAADKDKPSGFREQHVYAVYGFPDSPFESDLAYVPVGALAGYVTALPLIGLSLRGRTKADHKGIRGSRSVATNPDPLDSFDFVKPVVAFWRKYPPKPRGPLFSGAPEAERASGRFYYRLMAAALKDYARYRGIDPKRLNPHCFRLLGHQQLTAAGCSEGVIADQGAWRRASESGAKGALVYYRLHFWNHAWRPEVRRAMYDKSIPLAQLNRHCLGDSIAAPMAACEKRARRREVAAEMAALGEASF